jgi:hypothetical protein
MPPEKKRKAVNDRLEGDGELRGPNFICKCKNFKNLTHQTAIECERTQKWIIHQGIANK